MQGGAAARGCARPGRIRRVLDTGPAGLGIPAAALGILAAALSGWSPRPAAGSPDSAVVVAGPQYAKPSLHRFLFGSDYRDLWTTPIRVEVLDMKGEAGGLSVVRRVGGKQTQALALKGADGRSYTFRGLEKDASGLIDEELIGTIVEDLVRDQFAAQHPASELIAGSIQEDLFVPAQRWRLVALPDDEALGEFRKEFAGAVGFYGEYPTGPAEGRSGTFDLLEILDHREMYRRLEAGEARVDQRALLRDRLLDLFFGDWDRHRRQWRWARFPGDSLWTPVPEDRDQAFARYEGLVLGLVRRREPRFQNFGPEYGSIEGLTWNGRDQDRQLLVWLEREEYARTASELRADLTDTVLIRAAAAMPPAWRALDRPRLLEDLKSRREALGEIADRYYRHLAGRVDLVLTSRDDVVDAIREPGGDLTIIARAVSDSFATSYRRVFRARETHEVRLYLLDGNDRVTVTGPAGGIRVRVVGGDGDDTLSARGSGPAKLSDSSGRDAAIGADWDDRPYRPPPPSPSSPWIRPRDWGGTSWSVPWVSYGPDLGLFLGAGVEYRRYSFRKHPYAQRHLIRGGYAFGERNGKIEYRGAFRHENRPSLWALHGYGSGVEVLRFYGFGNETPDREDSDSTKVEAGELLASIAYERAVGDAVWSVGPLVKYLDTEEEPAGSLANIQRPYGVGGFGAVGVHAVLGLDRRDRAMFPRRGVNAAARGTVYPELWDVERTFSEVNGSASWYVAVGPAVTFAVRGGGKRVFGRFPFHEAATIGGGSLGAGSLDEGDYTVRGFRAQRFSGRSSLYGNAEARLQVGRATLFIPGDWGVLGFGDTGRVWSDGEDSERWHTGVGGGLWISFLNYSGTGSAGLAHSDEGDRFYFKGGFTF